MICVAYTVTSFKEIPLDLLEISDAMHAEKETIQTGGLGGASTEESEEIRMQNTYGTLDSQVNINIIYFNGKVMNLF